MACDPRKIKSFGNGRILLGCNLCGEVLGEDPERGIKGGKTAKQQRLKHQGEKPGGKECTKLTPGVKPPKLYEDGVCAPAQSAKKTSYKQLISPPPPCGTVIGRRHEPPLQVADRFRGLGAERSEYRTNEGATRWRLSGGSILSNILGFSAHLCPHDWCECSFALCVCACSGPTQL